MPFYRTSITKIIIYDAEDDPYIAPELYNINYEITEYIRINSNIEEHETLDLSKFINLKAIVLAYGVRCDGRIIIDHNFRIEVFSNHNTDVKSRISSIYYNAMEPLSSHSYIINPELIEFWPSMKTKSSYSVCK